MEKFLFRKAEKRDIPAILDIYNLYIATTNATFDHAVIEEPELLCRVPVGHDRYPTYIIEESSGNLAGFCFLTRFRNKPAYDRTAEAGIYLKPNFTGKGIGRLAVELLETEAADNGFSVLIASVSGDNTASIKLFEKSGYERCACYRQVAEKSGCLLDIVDFEKILSE